MYTLGIDLGGTAVKAGLFDENMKAVSKITLRTHTAQGVDAVLQDVVNACTECVRRADVCMNEILTIGVGVPGTVSRDGKVLLAPNIFMRNYDLGGKLSDILGKSVFIQNDANCAALAEADCGAGKGFENVILLTFGTGVGMGIVANGTLFGGAHGLAGEAGHIPLMHGGKACNCGNNGCYEKYASVSALVEMTKDKMQKSASSLLWQVCRNLEDVSGKTAFLAAASGDKAASEIIEEFTDCVASGIAGIINLFDPDVVILGGGLSNEGDGFILPVREKAIAYTMAYHSGAPVPQIVKAQLGNSAGMTGAAIYAKCKKEA